jgi:hypothetical protein
MGTKPRLLLLDAGGVIHAHKCGGWSNLCERYEVIVPSVIRGEAAFYLDDDRKRIPIDLGPDVNAKRIVEYSASTTDMAATLAALPRELVIRIHAGEIEALTYLQVHGTKDIGFVSGDGGAIEATVVLGCSEVAMSLESALRQIGLTKKLPAEHSDRFITEAKKRGGETLIKFGRR